MGINRSIRTVALAVVTLLAISVVHGTSVAAAEACMVSSQGLAMGNSGNISVSGNQATVRFRVNGTNCTTPVSVASWIRITPEGINDQKLFAHNTKTFGPGLHSIAVKLPACMYQVDLIEGSHYTAADGTANYQYQNGQIVDGGLRDFMKGGTGSCQEEPEVCPYDKTMPKESPDCLPPKKPEVPPTSTTTTITKTKVVNNTITNNELAVTPVSSVPSTGPASAIGATFGISSVTGTAYSFIQSRRKLKSLL